MPNKRESKSLPSRRHNVCMSRCENLHGDCSPECVFLSAGKASVSENAPFTEKDVIFAKMLRDTLKNAPYPTIGNVHTWQIIETWAENLVRLHERDGGS